MTPPDLTGLPPATILYVNGALHVKGCACSHDKTQARGFPRPGGHRLLSEAEACGMAVLARRARAVAVLEARR